MPSCQQSSSFYGKKKSSICIRATMKTVTFSFKITSITPKKKKTQKISKFQICQAYVCEYIPEQVDSSVDFIMAQIRKSMTVQSTKGLRLRPAPCWSHQGSCCWLTYTDFSVSHSFKVS